MDTVRRIGGLAAVLLVSIAVLLPSRSAAAADGFDQLSWGMSRKEVRAAYPGKIIETDRPEYPPEGTEGAAFKIDGQSELLGQSVQMECHFKNDRLVVVRLRFLRQRSRNIEKVLGWYEEHSGDPLRSVKKKGGRKTTTWAWPWEGIELKSVQDDGEIRYQRLDFSDQLRRKWRSAEAAVCSILPKSSSCAFPDRFCAAKAKDIGDGQRDQVLEVAEQSGEVACKYEDGKLHKIVLKIPGANDNTAAWVGRILDRSLGSSLTSRDDRSSRAVRLKTTWEQHPVKLIVTRKAKLRTKKGWTGPVEFLSIHRTISAP